MVVAGVFTVKVGRVIEEVCERSFSKQSVFEACAELNCAVRAFCDWPLKGGDGADRRDAPVHEGV